MLATVPISGGNLDRTPFKGSASAAFAWKCDVGEAVLRPAAALLGSCEAIDVVLQDDASGGARP